MHHSRICLPLATILGLLLMIIPGLASAAGYALSGVGSKAIAMGGAFRGLADDYSAAYWNPAGLALHEGFELSFTGIGILPDLTMKPNITEIPGYTREAGNVSNSWIWIPNGAFSTQVGSLSWLRLGIAGYVPSGLRSKLDLYDLPPGFDSAGTFPEYEWNSRLDVFDLHPTIAVELLDGRLGLGVGGSIQYASATLQRPIFRPTLRGIAFEQLPPQLQDLLSQVASSPQALMPIDMLMEGNGWAYGINAGLLLKPLSNLSFGISGRTKSTFTLEGDATLALYTPGNPELAAILKSTGAPELIKLSALFSGRVLQAKGGGSTELILPPDIGLGVAWEPFDWITLTGDATWAGWSAFEALRIQFEDIELLGSPIPERVIPERWEDVVRFSAGMELRPTPGLALRGGYYLDPSPIPASTQGPLIPDIGDKLSINLGVGLDVGSAALSLNYEYILWPDRTIAQFEDVDGDGEPDNLPGEYSMSLQSVMSTLTFRF